MSDEPIPSQRIAEKRISEFADIPELPIEANGKRTFPTLMTNQIETWVRSGAKLLADGRFTTLASGNTKAFCVVSCDKEKVTAIQQVVQDIELARQDAAKTKAAMPEVKPT